MSYRKAAVLENPVVAEAEPEGRGGKAALVACLLVMAAGLVFRLWRLSALPAGMSHDEAYDALNAVDILNGQRPIFFESNNGREPLFMYLVALAFRVFGIGPFQIRLVAALGGVAAIFLTYLIVKRAYGARLAILTAALIAVSFWPVFDSRLGLRASLLPVFEALCVYGLWRWWEQTREGAALRSARWAALAGVGLGAALQTYTPALFAVLIPIGFMAHLAWRRFVPWRRAACGLTVALGVALIVYAPLAFHFVSNPTAFGERVGQVNDLRFILQSGDFRPLLQDTLNTLGMFTVAGDPSMRYNLAGRPVFDPLSSLLFVIGLLVCVKVSFRRETARGKPDSRAPYLTNGPAGALLVLWLVAALLPSATTGESPHFLRGIGAQAVVFVFPAVGLPAMLGWLGKRWPALTAGRAWMLIAVVLVMGTAALTGRDYFGGWSGAAEAQHIYNAAYGEAVQSLDDAPAVRTFVSGEYPRDIDRFVVNMLRGDRAPAVSWFDGRESLVLPATGPADYMLPPSAMPPNEVLRRYVDVTNQSPTTGLWHGSVTQPVEVAPEHPLAAKVGDYLTLIGYDLPDEAKPGGSLRVTMYWKVVSRPPEPISLFAHLIGARGSLWGQKDGLGYPEDQWQAGDVLIEWHDIPVPVGAPPVDYEVEAGAYFLASGARIPIESLQGTSDRLHLGTVHVDRSDASSLDASPVLRAMTQLGVQFESDLKLEGYTLSDRNPRAGARVQLTLYWRSLGPLAADYTVFNHLGGVNERPVAQADGPPAFGAYQTSRWQAGDLIRDQHEIEIPADTRPGRYWLLTGLYLPPDGPRLTPISTQSSLLDKFGRLLEQRTPFIGGPRVDGDHVILTAVDVQQKGRDKGR